MLHACVLTSSAVFPLGCFSTAGYYVGEDTSSASAKNNYCRYSKAKSPFAASADESHHMEANSPSSITCEQQYQTIFLMCKRIAWLCSVRIVVL